MSGVLVVAHFRVLGARYQCNGSPADVVGSDIVGILVSFSCDDYGTVGLNGQFSRLVLGSPLLV